MNPQDSRLKTQDPGFTYAQAGVDTAKEEEALAGFLHWVNKTLHFRKDLGRSHLEIGFFATVIDIGGGMGLVLTTDGVGTKLLVAQMLGKYDTVGIDCVAMNVNDLICVAAEPICMLDYLAIEEPSAEVLEQIGKGLYEGARQANISIPGGETAQLREMLKGVSPGLAFDLAGMGLGLVALEKVNIGQEIQPGDALIGLASSGIHSNGLTLARRIFFDTLGWNPNRHVEELGQTIGEELLVPTRIYVRPILKMLACSSCVGAELVSAPDQSEEPSGPTQVAPLHVKGLANITGGGLLNLRRFKAGVGFEIEELPPAMPIFRLIQECGNVTPEEMFSTFNMGVGFCVVVPEGEAEKAIEICRSQGCEASQIGQATADGERKIILPDGLTLPSGGITEEP